MEHDQTFRGPVIVDKLENTTCKLEIRARPIVGGNAIADGASAARRDTNDSDTYD